MGFMYESHMVRQPVDTFPLDGTGILAEADFSEQGKGLAVGSPDNPVAGDTRLYRGNAGCAGAGYGSVTEGAVQADTRELVAVAVHLGTTVGVDQGLIVGVGNVREGDRLFRALVETEDRKRIAEPRCHDEHHDETQDSRYPDATKGEYRDQDLYPGGPSVIRLRLLVQCLFTTRHARRLLTLTGWPGRVCITRFCLTPVALLVPPRVDVFQPFTADVDDEEDVDESDDYRDRPDYIKEGPETGGLA